MAIYRPIALQFNAAIAGTQAEIQKNIVAVAKREHAKVMSTVPIPAIFRRTVDGVANQVEERVKSNGWIRYEYPRLELVVRSAILALIDKSPFLSGQYIRGHRFFVDGIETPWESDWMSRWRPGQELAIANFVPYSRKIELGKMKMRVPGTDHVYEQAQQIVQRKYGNMATIRYTWRGIIPGANRGMVGGREGNQSDIRYPALIITERR